MHNAPKDARVVVLSETLALLPFNASFIDSRNIEMLAMTEAGHSELPLNICEVCESLSRNAKVAYVEAEYFGGQGGQASVKWEDGRIIETPNLTQNAINDALVFLGVKRTKENDEFDTAVPRV